VLVTTVGAAAGLILCLTSVWRGAAGRVREPDFATVLVVTSDTTWLLLTGVA